jgi:hypothetical protein
MTYSKAAALGLAASAAAALAMPALAAGPTHLNVPFTSTLVGASISPTETVYKVHDSVMGNGAAVQKLTQVTAAGGKDTTIVYYGKATATARDTFTFGQPDANGIIPITGRGHDVSGTGKLRHITSTYTFTGTYDPKTSRVVAKLKGKESY